MKTFSNSLYFLTYKEINYNLHKIPFIPFSYFSLIKSMRKNLSK